MGTTLYAVQESRCQNILGAVGAVDCFFFLCFLKNQRWVKKVSLFSKEVKM